MANVEIGNKSVVRPSQRNLNPCEQQAPVSAEQETQDVIEWFARLITEEHTLGMTAEEIGHMLERLATGWISVEPACSDEARAQLNVIPRVIEEAQKIRCKRTGRNTPPAYELHHNHNHNGNHNGHNHNR